MIRVVLFGRLHMLLLEAIVLWVCVYLAFIFATFYLFLEAYPIIFQGKVKDSSPSSWTSLTSHGGIHDMSPDISDLAFTRSKSMF